MIRVVALTLDRVEVGNNSALSIGNGDVLMAGALDNGKRNDLVRHCTGRLVNILLLVISGLFTVCGFGMTVKTDRGGERSMATPLLCLYKYRSMTEHSRHIHAMNNTGYGSGPVAPCLRVTQLAYQ